MSLAHGLGLPAWLLALGVFLAVHAAGLGVVLGYHRLLTHRVARLPKLLERSIVTLGLPAGTPVQWIGNHRFHHVVADTEADPHSPTMHGF